MAKVQRYVSPEQFDAASSKLDQVQSDLSGKASSEDVSQTEQALGEANQKISDLQAKQATVKKFYSGTSTQTVANKMRVLIPHGIPSNEPVPAVSPERTPILTAVTTAAAGFTKVSVDATNIIVDYDVAVVSGTNGWVMKYMI